MLVYPYFDVVTGLCSYADWLIQTPKVDFRGACIKVIIMYANTLVSLW